MDSVVRQDWNLGSSIRAVAYQTRLVVGGVSHIVAVAAVIIGCQDSRVVVAETREILIT